MRITKDMFKEAASLSIDVINYLKATSPETKDMTLILSMAITYATLSKMLNLDLHKVMELTMTVYKNTEVIRDE